MLHEGAKITYVGWLTREGRKKQASSLVVEFTTKYHANRVTREGLVLNAIHHDCVLYDKSCRLKQCYRYHESGHIGPRCDAEERCGYCAGKHNTKECMVKETDPKPAPSCVLCKGLHTEKEGNDQDRTGPTESTCLLLRKGRFWKVSDWSPRANRDARPDTSVESGENTEGHRYTR